ncbi:hypothetical protein NDU88_001537 [Pleurodeles waltl]|uniref:Uncharacterized protein n=1 Tax=Pleurodeles waltl TaxID=8319 RepID=A0AAV7T0F5_PLEWA|nr:hypothetical protein NDU88_001537 [Pleurodeles waltl]
MSVDRALEAPRADEGGGGGGGRRQMSFCLTYCGKPRLCNLRARARRRRLTVSPRAGIHNAGKDEQHGRQGPQSVAPTRTRYPGPDSGH